MAEQGLGDQILFASLIPDLIARSEGPLLMDCEPRLVPLFARSFPGVQMHPYDAKQREGRTHIEYEWTRGHDAELMIELGSLPKLLRSSLESFPLERAPLIADESESARWRAWLASLGPGPKIGLCWRSGSRGALRSLQYAPLAEWARFIAEPRGHLIVVQYDLTDEELDELSSSCDRPIHVPPGLDQRSEIDRLAALLSTLDAIVSAPTVVGTLAAAMGTPAIKVTQAGSWTALGRGHDAFLPKAKIIRPRRAGEWGEAFQLAAHALDGLLARR